MLTSEHFEGTSNCCKVHPITWVTLIGVTQIAQVILLVSSWLFYFATLRHRTSRVLEVLLESELGFALVECFSDRFGRAFVIVHSSFAVGTVLVHAEHKFGHRLEVWSAWFII